MATTETVESVHFKFLTDDEVRSHSVVKITNTELLDTIESGVTGGLYDSAMGPLDDHSSCSSCGQRSYQCPGHCGHIDLVSPAYNPLLFSMLSNLLNKTCFTCFQFRARREEVDSLVTQLEMISMGNIIGAKNLSLQQALQDRKKLDLPLSDDIVAQEPVSGTENPYDSNVETCWDSCQLTEAMSILNEFFKKKDKKCRNCECNNPKITKPTFGWFHVTGLSSNQIRSNVIRRSRLNVADSRGDSDKHSSEVIDDSEIAEANSYEATPVTKKHGEKGVSRRNLNENPEDPTNYFSGPLLPSEVRDILKRLWQNEGPLCSYICNVQQRHHKSSGNAEGYSMFFLDTILVPPIKFRPPAKGGNTVMEHPHTVLLGKVLQSNIALGNAHINNAEHSKIINRWMDLQQSINVLFDSKTASRQAQKDASGICQYLEKKEGIFRQKMMGKRVNFACRSVISPDPYLAVNEIGIPPYFALRLTYPERVTPWNAEKLRGAVMNGPEIYPGAISYADSVATLKLAVSKNLRAAISRRLPSSRGAVSEIRKNGLDFEGKIVYRHLQDGDIVLVNRQPTLHKPSIMAHVVRVLKGEKTLRMHYANCSSYNADFDGDEINVHFPQDEISRAEAYNIVNANEQYIVPTKGDTVRGLIQDHIVGAVLLTLKNTFLNHTEFSQLLYGSGVFTRGSGSYPGNNSRKVSLVESEDFVECVFPTIWKPEPLWTGKQVITALLNHITRGCAPCTMKNQGKVPKNYYAGSTFKNGEEDEDHNAEHDLLIWKNELLRGVIDKAQFGKFGLVHTIQELYGSNSAGILLSALSRLFTVFLQFHGFTCGMDDLIILPDYDAKRKKKLEREDVGEEVHCDFVKFKPGQIGPEELQLEVEKVICQDRESSTASLDMKMKNKLTNRLTREGSQILKHLLTAGLLKPFPKNCISVMTTTGAKGSTVNFQQISAYLGQQELEGKRVPRMVSGKTLPSFPPWDFTSRAGGFITDRFLTGLRPQEYYFHCMAGREGLVDTAVKTSRSGYLQRCLIKNLESLKVSYDYTVRDSDGSIVQFFYGEDGIDVHKTSFLNNFKALEDNQETLVQKFGSRREFDGYIKKLPKGLEKEARKFIQKKQDKSLVKKKGSGREHSRMKPKSRKSRDIFLELVEQKYLSSLVQAGEPVGVIAAQSIGEPSTQMTLNTFHLAGRGEMNVTLGIPRLQEILMTASDVIKTPLLTCPFSEWRSKNYVVSLVSSVKKISVADLVESMDVQISVNQSKVYKLTIKLKDSEFVSLEDTQETLKSAFLRELEDAIESHVIFLSKVSGIKNYASSSRSEATNEGDEDDSGDKRREMNDDNDDDDDDDDRGDDLGADVQKRKQQATDEMNYDGPDDDSQENEQSAGVESHGDDSDHPEEKDDDAGDSDNKNEASQSRNKILSKTKSSREKVKKASKGIEDSIEGLSSKKVRRAIYVDCDGLRFEVHFRFATEPHLLIAQLAQKTAKKVFIKRSGKSKISQCKVVQYDPDEKTVIWDDDKKPNQGQSRKQDKGEETLYWAMKASGVDFKSIWEMHDDLDLTRLYSNNIHAVLRTYGVEAARATIIREVKQVFDIYGVKIDFRHLSLIADYMTHTGGYRPFSRHGSIAESLSPFLKMSFETASKFIVEAASHGLVDKLETPSSRICLGLPAKVGTGCFDLMQKLEV